MQQNNLNQQNAPQQQSGLGIAGMVIGIVSLLLACLVVGGFTGIVGLVLSIVGITQKNKKSGTAIAGIVLNTLAIFIMIFMFAIASSSDEDAVKNVTSDNTIESVEASISDSIPSEDIAASVETNDFPEESETVESITEDNTETESIPKEYESALNKANIYSDTMYMSKTAIYDQLTSEYGEQFSAEAAQYAMDHITADWNANALEKAKTYSDTMYMSKAAIYDQLVSEYGEKFTEEEAQYAIDNIVADWNLNALEKAKTYQDMMDMSPAAIHDQLVSEYGEKFTVEEADYAIANLE